MSAPVTLTQPFVPLFRSGEHLYGYFADYPRPVYRSLHVGKRWSSTLSSALPIFSRSKRVYMLSKIHLTYVSLVIV